VAEVGRRSRDGRLGRNVLVGIRIPDTLADDAAWYAAHRAAGTTMLRSGLACAGVALAGGLAGSAWGEGWATGLVVAGIALLLVGVLRAGAIGQRAARASGR
jgi:hypothetical protein